jgi:hypothetical protein
MQKSIVRLPHGSLQLSAVTVSSYSLELHEGEGFVGDNASRTAFREMLENWRTLFRKIDGKDPMGPKPTDDIDKQSLDELLAKKGPAAAAIQSALEDYAVQLARVVRRFRGHSSWQGVERVIIGGGFKQSEVGEHAVKRAAKLLLETNEDLQLRTLRHHADEGGLIGWVHVAPSKIWSHYQAMLAVDIGGTNVRCGIVQVPGKKEADLAKAEVTGLEKWGHADDQDATRREHLVEGIAEMLEKLMAKAKKKGVTLAPFIGVACPGHIHDDGTITRGAQNLPGNWEHPRFHLPEQLSKLLPPIDGEEAQVRLHNDAVVQGLSELPYTQDIKRWAMLTVGTGLGNASYLNR